MSSKQNKSRRQFLKAAAQAGLVSGLSVTALKGLAGVGQVSLARGFSRPIPYTQEPLPYGYGELEPAIDTMTMEIHYSKHGAAYAKNLAEAVKAEGVNTGTVPLEEVLANISRYSVKMRNNAGGHYNHELFWKSMGRSSGLKPSGSLLQAIERDFGSLDTFKTQFGEAAKTRFGSGWAWLVLAPDKKLIIGSTANQDNPLMDISDLKGVPVLSLDVWEHAYYLKYQNRRPDYINAWWNVVNWEVLQNRFDG